MRSACVLEVIHHNIYPVDFFDEISIQHFIRQSVSDYLSSIHHHNTVCVDKRVVRTINITSSTKPPTTNAKSPFSIRDSPSNAM